MKKVTTDFIGGGDNNFVEFNTSFDTSRSNSHYSSFDSFIGGGLIDKITNDSNVHGDSDSDKSDHDKTKGE